MTRAPSTSFLPVRADLQPHVSAAIAYFRFFEPTALSFLSDATVEYARDPNGFGANAGAPISDLTPKGAADPAAALRTTVAQAYRWYWEEREWSKARKTKDFLPLLLVQFCPSCPPKWAGRKVVFRVEDLRGYPLRHCSSLRCEGRVQQGSKQLLNGAELVDVNGQL